MLNSSGEFALRVRLLGLLFLFLFFIITARLFQIQVINHKEARKQIDHKLTRTEYFMSGRGRILTRDGQVLAHDVPSYELICILSDLSFSDKLGILEELDFFINSKSKRFSEVRAMRPHQEDLSNKIKQLTVRLKREPILIMISRKLGIDLNELCLALTKAMDNVVKRWALLHSSQRLKLFISPEIAKKLLSTPELFPGFSCVESAIREYPQGTLASHLVGYLGRLKEEDYNVLRIRGYYPPLNSPLNFKPIVLRELEKDKISWARNFLVGASGVEWIRNDDLRGKLHKRTFRRDLQQYNHVDIEDGLDITLTIDGYLQQMAKECLNGRDGVVVVFNLDDGDVLINASNPSYDPNFITPPIQVPNFMSYIESKPGILMNKAIQSSYPFGSIYKIVTGTAILEEEIVDSRTQYVCTKRHAITRIPCLGTHGAIDIGDALKCSCNPYFCEMALRLGPHELYNWSRRFLLGAPLTKDFPSEKKGLIPNPIYKRNIGQGMWYPGDTGNMSIGQGFQLGTPLQAAWIAAFISREQAIAKPRFWKDAPINKVSLNIKTSTRDAIRTGMYKVLNHPGGTAYGSRSSSVIYAGKSGSAQVGGKNGHAWFVGFAPYNKPKIAFSVLLEHSVTKTHGGGGSLAAPIAKKLVEAWAMRYNHIDR